MTEAKKRYGIIQSRGLGDLIIALPIAWDLTQKGYQVVWPICREFFTTMQNGAPWVDWVPMDTDNQGLFFYDRPMQIINERHCTDWVCLYQSLTGHPELAARPYFQFQSFDQHKYTAAGVPFLKKWTLRECLVRNPEREAELKQRLNPEGRPYYITHFKGSSFECTPSLDELPKEWLRLDIDEHITDSLFDWISLLEGAEAVIALDSVVANLVDQLLLEGPDLYWIPRSHIHLTPILGCSWQILEAPQGSLASQAVFQAAR